MKNWIFNKRSLNAIDAENLFYLVPIPEKKFYPVNYNQISNKMFSFAEIKSEKSKSDSVAFFVPKNLDESISRPNISNKARLVLLRLHPQLLPENRFKTFSKVNRKEIPFNLLKNLRKKIESEIPKEESGKRKNENRKLKQKNKGKLKSFWQFFRMIEESEFARQGKIKQSLHFCITY